MAQPQSRWAALLEGIGNATDKIKPWAQAFGAPGSFVAQQGINYLNAPVAAPTAAAPTPMIGDIFGIGPVAAAAPVQPQGDPYTNIFNSLIQQESGGRAGVLGPQTRYGRAEGMTQMLPATAKETAEKNGIPWRPELMRGTSPEAAEYQRQLGRLYFNEGLERTGSVEGALMYYHGGPNQRLWGPKTRAYAQQVLERAGASSGGQMDPLQALIARGQAAGQGAFASVDPRLAMAMIPDPITLQGVTLPNAPQRALPQDLPQYEAADKNTLLADMRAAAQVPERDNSNDPWERIQAMLIGAAGGAAQAGPTDDFGRMLLLAGGGGLQGFTGEREQQRALDLEQDAQARQMALMLANAGLELDLSALGTRNTNLDRGWQSGENRADTIFGNETGQFNRNVAQANMDLGVQQYNVGARNQANMTRGQAGLGAIEGAVNAANQGTQLGIQLAAAQANPDPRQADAQIVQSIRSAGIVENEQTVAVARAIGARNSNALMPHVAASVLQNGLWETMLAEEDAQKVQQFVQQEKPEMALAIVQQALAATAQQEGGREIMNSIIDELDGMGDPVGQLVRRARGGE